MSRQLNRVLVAFKKSPYQLYVKERGDDSVGRALDGNDSTARKLKEGHLLQLQALQRVESVLDRQGIRYDSRWRGKVRSVAGKDMVLAVGGDGTLLDMASHIDDETPLFGVNSDPQRSVGLLCACTAADFAERLEEFRSGTLRATPHARIRVRVDGQEVLGPCLNDILFAHRSPADMSRFEMAIVPRERVEELKPDEPLPWFPLRGSGIWIATATGSTAAICSAGGKVQPPRSRRLQYMVRELYTPPHEAQAITPHGFLDPKGALVLVSRMHRAMVWADGPHRKIAIRYGQRITIDVHPQPLMLVRTNYR